MWLEGLGAPDHPLSLPKSLERLPRPIRDAVQYDPVSLWEHDTRLLSPALQKYRRQVRHFARTVLAPRALPSDSNEHGADTQEILAAAGREGLLSDLLPKPFGSLPPWVFARAFQLVHSIKMEELCAGCGGLGLLIGAHALGTIPLVLSGSLSTIRRFVLPAYRENFEGRPRVFAYGITEPSGGSDVEDSHGGASYRPFTTARKVPGGWRLRGRKVFISGGDIALGVCAFAAIEGEGLESWTCFYVERQMEGFERGRSELKMGQRASSATELIFDDVFIPDGNVVGKVRGGWGLNRTVLNYSRIPVGAIALGIARGAMEAATGFSLKHRLGGKRLADYQDVQLSLAQMMMETQAMRALLWQSASGIAPTQARSSMAKVFCSDTAVAVCERAMELLGNHGFLRGNLAEKGYRDARLTQIYEGTNQINRLSILEDQMEALLGNSKE
ncbi:MAG: acyl-CoA dehydrogenase family protein [Bdellovibrionota bacterium]